MDPRVYSRAELLRDGADDAYLRRAVRRGALTKPRPGYFARPDADPNVLTAVGRGGALSCISELRRRGFWTPPGYDSLHVRASRHHRDKRQDFCALPGRPLPVTTAVDDIPTALVCAAGCLSEEDWIAVCDSVANSTRTSIPDLAAQLPQTSRRIERLLDKCDARSQSGTESIVRVRLRARGFHVEVQPEISGVGHADLRLGRLLIECDSELHHTSRANYRNDRRRDRKSLLRHDRPTLRLTYDDVLYGWDDVLDDIVWFTDRDRHRIRRRPGE
ncbi:hypothetical protein ACWDTI_18570 [Gordonia sp. NPDC003424]